MKRFKYLLVVSLLFFVVSTCQAVIVYETDYHNMFYSSGQWTHGAPLAGDGWSGANPYTVLENVPPYGWYLQGAAYQYSRLDLASAATAPGIEISFICLGTDPGSEGPGIGRVYGTGDVEIGRVVLIGPNLYLDGSSQVLASAWADWAGHDLLWTLDYNTKTMSLSVNGSPPVSTGFKDNTVTDLATFDMWQGNATILQYSGYQDTFKIEAIPEPCTILLLGAGFVGILSAKRKK
jgi:hypothetical protein